MDFYFENLKLQKYRTVNNGTVVCVLNLSPQRIRI